MVGASSVRLACSFALSLWLSSEHACAATPVVEPKTESAPRDAEAGRGELSGGTGSGAAANEQSSVSEGPGDLSAAGAPELVAEPERAVVAVSVIGGRGPLIEEALLRIQAELRAVGFGVHLSESMSEQATAEASASSSQVGTIVLVSSADSVQILAQAYAEAPLSQQVDLAKPSSTAEVLAVRAVEALRAALLQSLRNRRALAQTDSVPDPVRVFTQWSAQRAPEPAPPPAPRPAPPAAPQRRTQQEPSPWLLTAGPLLVAPAPGALLTGGVEAQVERTLGPAFAGVVVDAAIIPAKWKTRYGAVEASQRSLLAIAGLDLSCPANFACQLGASFGARWTSFVALPDDEAAPVETAEHRSLLVEGDALVGYFFDERAGLVGRARVGTLLDAPVMTAAHEETISWGRPTWGLSLCAALRL